MHWLSDSNTALVLARCMLVFAFYHTLDYRFIYCREAVAMTANRVWNFVRYLQQLLAGDAEAASQGCLPDRLES